METLLDLHLAGYNVCLLVGGESGSGKTYNVAGESSNRAGLVQMVLDHLFAKLSEGEHICGNVTMEPTEDIRAEAIRIAT